MNSYQRNIKYVRYIHDPWKHVGIIRLIYLILYITLTKVAGGNRNIND
jgi:hypothetical protein